MRDKKHIDKYQTVSNKGPFNKSIRHAVKQGKSGPPYLPKRVPDVDAALPSEGSSKLHTLTTPSCPQE